MVGGRGAVFSELNWESLSVLLDLLNRCDRWDENEDPGVSPLAGKLGKWCGLPLSTASFIRWVCKAEQVEQLTAAMSLDQARIENITHFL